MYIRKYTNKDVNVLTKRTMCLLVNTLDDELFQKKKSNLLQRYTDTLYCLTKDVINVYDKLKNPEYTKTDQLKKEEIFEVESSKECFITGMKSGVGAGDHLFEIRGYVNETGMHGSNSKWNLVPVTLSENRGYKKFMFDDGVKNIGYQTLSKEEYKKCTQKQKTIYNKIQRWKAYVKKRGARISFIIPENVSKEMDGIVKMMYETGGERQEELLKSIN